MAFAAAALMAVSTIYSFVSARQEGEEQAAAHRYNQQVYANQATALEQRAGLERSIAAEKAKRVAYLAGRAISQQKADYGSSGVDYAEGSPLEVIAESAKQGKLQELDQVYAGELGAYGFLTQASAAKAQAGLEQYNARLARSAANRKAYGSLLGGFAGTGLAAYNMGLFKGGGGGSGTDVGGFGLMAS